VEQPSNFLGEIPGGKAELRFNRSGTAYGRLTIEGFKGSQPCRGIAMSSWGKRGEGKFVLENALSRPAGIREDQ